MFIIKLWNNFGIFMRTNVRNKRYGPIYASMAGIAFLGGAGVEFAMIKWRPGGVNFYDVYKEKLVRTICDERERAAEQAEAKEAPTEDASTSS